MGRVFNMSVSILPAQGGITTNEIARVLGQARFSAMMASAPANVLWGGALVYAGGDFIYAFRGNGTTAFWRVVFGVEPNWRSWMR